MVTLAWILGVALAMSFLCSILEAVFLSTTHSYIAVLRERGEWAGEWLHAAQKNVDEPIAAILTLNTVAHTVGATMAGAEAARVFGSTWVGIFSAVLTFVILVFTEIIPKTIGATYWQRLAKPSAYLLRVMVVLMKPVIVPLGWLSGLLSPRAERPTISRAELEVLAEIGRREGTLDEDEWKVVSSVIRLGEVSIGEVMTPRTDIVAIPAHATLEETQNLMLDTGVLRLPVFEGDLDTIVGIVVARDLWRAIREGGSRSVRDVMRPMTFAPASKPVEDLIPEMRQQRTKMAIVVDEFGGTAGLVTLEDLIEEIVGEIQDEHEGHEPVAFEPLHGGRVRVWGAVSLRDAIARLGFNVDPEDEEYFDTIGGYVFGQLDRLPEAGDTVPLDTGALRVSRMTGRRIEYLEWVPAPEPRKGR